MRSNRRLLKLTLSWICFLTILILPAQNPIKKDVDVRKEYKEVNKKLDSLLINFNIPVPVGCDTIRKGRIRDGSTIYYILKCGDTLKYVDNGKTK